MISILFLRQNRMKSIAAFRFRNDPYALPGAKRKSTLNDMNPNYLFRSVFDM